MQAEADDTVIVRVERQQGLRRDGPKASMSRFARLAQWRPGPVVSAMFSPAGPER